MLQYMAKGTKEIKKKNGTITFQSLLQKNRKLVIVVPIICLFAKTFTSSASNRTTYIPSNIPKRAQMKSLEHKIKCMFSFRISIFKN